MIVYNYFLKGETDGKNWTHEESNVLSVGELVDVLGANAIVHRIDADRKCSNCKYYPDMAPTDHCDICGRNYRTLAGWEPGEVAK